MQTQIYNRSLRECVFVAIFEKINKIVVNNVSVQAFVLGRRLGVLKIAHSQEEIGTIPRYFSQVLVPR